jgi:hypothetical protein
MMLLRSDVFAEANESPTEAKEGHGEGDVNEVCHRDVLENAIGRES